MVAIVEIIDKSGYSRDSASKNIVVVTEEDYIQIRYLLVLKLGVNANHYAHKLDSTKIDFDTHY